MERYESDQKSKQIYELLYRKRPFVYTMAFFVALLAFSTIGLGILWEFLAVAHHSPYEILTGR